MAIKIRFTRMGDKKTPHYRLVAADTRCARDGKVVETLGTYNPLVTPVEFKLKEDRINYWLGVGAQPTQTARELLVKAGLLKKAVYVAPRPKKQPPAKKVEAPAAEEKVETPAAPVEEVAPVVDTPVDAE